MSKPAHQPGEKTPERGNWFPINPAYERHHSIHRKAVRDALREVLCRQELRNGAVERLNRSTSEEIKSRRLKTAQGRCGSDTVPLKVNITIALCRLGARNANRVGKE